MQAPVEPPKEKMVPERHMACLPYDAPTSRSSKSQASNAEDHCCDGNRTLVIASLGIRAFLSPAGSLGALTASACDNIA